MFVGFVFEQCNWKDSQFQLWLQILFRFLKRTKNLFPIWTGYSLRSRYGGRDVSTTVCVGFFSVPVIKKIPQQKSKLGKEGFVFSLWCLRGQSIIVGEAWQPELWVQKAETTFHSHTGSGGCGKWGKTINLQDLPQSDALRPARLPSLPRQRLGQILKHSTNVIQSSTACMARIQVNLT